MKELNKLTQRLFAEGYTKDRHPDYVDDWTYQSEFYGGFEYSRAKKNSMVFSTPCGLLIQGSYWNSGIMSYMGVTWSMENDNPTIRCPYSKVGCALNHEFLRDRAVGSQVECACHEVTVPYDYNRSWDIIEDEEQAVQEDLLKAYKQKMKGRVCREHCRFDSQKQQWRQLYDPIHVCAQRRCSFCSILQKELSRSRGNIFYDVKISTKVSGNGLFPDEYPVQIIKGKKFLEHPASMDICRIIARWFQREIIEREEGHYRRELFFAQHHGQYFQMEVFNIRAERRETRDEAQDLAEREAGYIVTHNSDQEKALREGKRARREERLQATIRRHLTNVTQHGLDGLETSDRIRIDRLIERGLLKQEELAEAQNEFATQQLFEQLKFR